MKTSALLCPWAQPLKKIPFLSLPAQSLGDCILSQRGCSAVCNGPEAWERHSRLGEVMAGGQQVPFCLCIFESSGPLTHPNSCILCPLPPRRNAIKASQPIKKAYKIPGGGISWENTHIRNRSRPPMEEEQRLDAGVPLGSLLVSSLQSL